MAKRKQAKAAIPYLRRLAEDEYVQGQLGDAAARLREVYRRGTQERGKAAEDKKLYRKAREAATSIRRAVGAIEEPPLQPKRRGRKALGLALVGAAALLARRAQKGKHSGPDGGNVPQAGRDAPHHQTAAEPVGAASA